MFAYCVSAAYQEAASVARHGGPRCASRRAPKGAVEERIHRGAGSGASTDVLREIGAPCREIGVEFDVYPRGVVRPPAEPAPLHSKRAVDRLANITLFAEEVLPRLRELSPSRVATPAAAAE